MRHQMQSCQMLQVQLLWLGCTRQLLAVLLVLLVLGINCKAACSHGGKA